MKFLHAADCHIDSPLRGLEKYAGAPVERVRPATREAFQNLVKFALEFEVDFLILAGDLFDGPWPDMQTGIWIAGQFRILQNADIDVFLLRGNHDAASLVQQQIEWPHNVQVFPTDMADSLYPRKDIGVVLHGQGFAHREVREDLVSQYPPPVEGLFNIGVLHTSLTGTVNHDTYAPTRPEILARQGYDYWALGHIHAAEIISREPYIVFPGNTQGRHVREGGAKGVYLVCVENGHIDEPQFLATDTLRWFVVDVVANPEASSRDLLNQISGELSGCVADADGRFCAVRLSVRGSSAAHRDLQSPEGREQFIAQVRDAANALGADLWIEQIRLQISPPIDLDQLEKEPGIVGELLRLVSEADQDEDLLKSLGASLASLSSQAERELSEIDVNLGDPQQLRQWLADARRLLISRILEA